MNYNDLIIAFSLKALQLCQKRLGLLSDHAHGSRGSGSRGNGAEAMGAGAVGVLQDFKSYKTSGLTRRQVLHDFKSYKTSSLARPRVWHISHLTGVFVKLFPFLINKWNALFNY